MFYARKGRTLGYSFVDNHGVDYYEAKAACAAKKPEYIQLSLNLFNDDNEMWKFIDASEECDIDATSN